MQKTFSSDLFKHFLSLIVKKDNCEYGFFLSDICDFLSIDEDETNKNIAIDEFGFSYYGPSLPQFKMCHVELHSSYAYRMNGTSRSVPSKCKYWICDGHQPALTLMLQNLVRTRKIQLTKEQAAILSITIYDAIECAKCMDLLSDDLVNKLFDSIIEAEFTLKKIQEGKDAMNELKANESSIMAASNSIDDACKNDPQNATMKEILKIKENMITQYCANRDSILASLKK